MFQNVRYRLLISYIAVLIVILSLFAIAVRISFARTLTLELNQRLDVLARASALSLEVENDEEDTQDSAASDSIEVDNNGEQLGDVNLSDEDGNDEPLNESDPNDDEDPFFGIDSQGRVLDIDSDEILVNGIQGIQWFDIDGNLLEEQGDYHPDLPFVPQTGFQTQERPYPARSFTIPVNDNDTGEFIGYVRVTESSEALQNALRNLDLGLGIGVVVALILSGFGGLWLTHQAMKPIERSFNRLQQFTADASHELRNPIMAIKSNASVALKYADGIREIEKFQAIASATTQMTALTEDLLLLARTDRATLRQHDRVDLTQLLTDLIKLYQADAELKQIQLAGNIAEQLFLEGDAVQLNRLFTNVLSNALRYTPEQGSIHIKAVRENELIHISVNDTGIGIAPEQLDHIFDRFWRADRSRSHGSGFGLGLAIAQNIAHQHHGTITATSYVGVGSCFTVKLPVSWRR